MRCYEIRFCYKKGDGKSHGTRIPCRSLVLTIFGLKISRIFIDILQKIIRVILRNSWESWKEKKFIKILLFYLQLSFDDSAQEFAKNFSGFFLFWDKNLFRSRSGGDKMVSYRLVDMSIPNFFYIYERWNQLFVKYLV